MFLQLIDTHFFLTNKLHQIFQNILNIINGHNKTVTQIKGQHQLQCNCRVKTECPLNGDCWKEDVM